MKELCIDTLPPLLKAIDIQRIELCSNLSVGGLSPDDALFDQVKEYCKTHQLKLMTMIRLRAGNFIYNREEIEEMKQKIIHFKHKGTDGVVFGCLTHQNEIDKKAIQYLMKYCDGLDVTFHMAFDQVPICKQKEALKTLKDLGIRRILTHGGPMTDPIDACIPHLEQLIRWAKPINIIIMPGGGINSSNILQLQTLLNTDEWHGTKIARKNQ